MICAAVAEDEKQRELKKIGAKDSKQLSPSARETLCPKIKKLCKAAKCIHITAKQLNELMARHSLNEIEAMKIAELLNTISPVPHKLIVDSPDTDTERFKLRLKKYLKIPRLEIVSEHRADVNHPIVSAASIVAKVERDSQIEKIKKELGADFGSGYSSDPTTISFLKKNFHKKEVAKYLRTRWETIQRLKQKKLEDF